MVSTTREKPTDSRHHHPFSPKPLFGPRHTSLQTSHRKRITQQSSFIPFHISRLFNNLPTQTDKRRTLSPGRMPLTNFDAVSKSFNTNRHDLFPTSYIPSFSPPFYTSLSDELPYSTAPLQPQQQYKPQSSQQQNHSTQSYSEEESEILEKDLPPEPKLENTKLRRRRRAYLWYKNKIFPVDWKDLTSPILTSSYLLRLFCEPALESTQRLNL